MNFRKIFKGGEGGSFSIQKFTLQIVDFYKGLFSDVFRKKLQYNFSDLVAWPNPKYHALRLSICYHHNQQISLLCSITFVMEPTKKTKFSKKFFKKASFKSGITEICYHKLRFPDMYQLKSGSTFQEFLVWAGTFREFSICGSTFQEFRIWAGPFREFLIWGGTFQEFLIWGWPFQITF